MTSNFDAVDFWVQVAADDGSFTNIPQGHRILSMTFTDVEEKADKLTITLANYDLHHIDSPVWRLGNKVKFGWGYGGIESPPRTATIDSISGGLELKIECSGQELDINKVQLEADVYENVKRSDVARILATKALGFTTDQLFIQDSEIVYPDITHGNMTAGRLLRLMAERLGWEYYTDFDGFHFHERVLNQRPQLTLKYHVAGPEGADIISFNMSKDADVFKQGSIVVQGRDPLTKEDVEILVSNDTVQRDTLGNVMISPSPDEDDANARRIGTHMIVPSRQKSRASMSQGGKGKWKKKQLNAFALAVTVRGIPGLLAKGVVRIEGISPTVDGPYYVFEATHKINPAPYLTVLKLQRDAKFMAQHPAEDPLPGQGDGVKTTGNVNNKQPKKTDELVMKRLPDGTVEFVSPGREIDF